MKVSISNKDKNVIYQKAVEISRELKELNIGRLDIGLDNPFDYIIRLIKDLGDDTYNASCAVKKPNPPKCDSGNIALKEPT